jgi:copper(I)-binding protein
MNSRLCFLILAMLLGVNAWAGEVTVSGAWVRATAPGQDSGSLLFSIKSRQEARLVAASSPVADKMEFHSMSRENGMMEMRAIDAINLPAGKTVDLEASGKHVMLVGLKQPLKAGDSVPFTLTVQYADNSRTKVRGRAEIRPLLATHENRRENDMHDMPGM